GALGGRGAGEPPLLPAARLLPLPARPPILAGGADRGAGRLRADPGRDRRRLAPSGAADVRDGPPRGGGSRPGLLPAPDPAAAGPPAPAGAGAPAGAADHGRGAPARGAGGGRAARQAAAQLRAVPGRALPLPADAAAALARGGDGARRLGGQRLGDPVAARAARG